MSYSNFMFLGVLPELHNSARRAEEAVQAKEPSSALFYMKQCVQGVMRQIVRDNSVETRENGCADLMDTLWQNKMITDDLYLFLKELDLLDARESDILLEDSRIGYLYHRLYDFVVWFYRTYVDASFVPGVFLQQDQGNYRLAVSRQETKESGAHTRLCIDGTEFAAEWEQDLHSLKDCLTVTYDNGEQYTGQMQHGMKHGQGKYTWRDGTVYKGEWRKDLEHGYGEKQFANGDVYRGDWKGGLFTGYGVYIWCNGTKYEGQWSDSFEHGFGTKTSPDGVKQKGLWTYGEWNYSTSRLNVRGDEVP